MRTLTRLSSEDRMHLTENGAVTLCGRAITHNWRRGARTGDRACGECRHQAAALGVPQVAPPHERASAVRRAVLA
jgi:hypothetical protein